MDMNTASEIQYPEHGLARTHIGTFTGRLVDPLNMHPDDLDIDDIGHALSRQCRFGGMTDEFYSVAQHSLLVLMELQAWAEGEDQYLSNKVLLMALLHDASEAYLLDLPTPIKYRMPGYMHAEEQLQKVIYNTFCGRVPSAVEESWIKHADTLALHIEAIDLCTSNAWTRTLDRPDAPKIRPRSPDAARRLFMLAYRTLHDRT